MTDESTTPITLQNSAIRQKLRSHFEVPHEQHNDRWDHLWKESFLPWDKGFPNPALIDALNDRQDLIVPAHKSGTARRRRALVPGCGKGYDVLLLASYGYDAYGLDVSESAIQACEAFARTEFASYPIADPEYGRGSYDFVCGDFFKSDWLQSSGIDDSGFDLIYDYTFLCALPAAWRPDWAKRMSDLLAFDQTSTLICLEFPTYKEPSTGGPPHGLKPEMYIAHLSRPGEYVKYNDEGYPILDGEPSKFENEKALVRVGHWQPERTHDMGMGTDWISVWKRAG
ncbi:MAG: hypothetical protein M1831_003130 [Alyxoria varia]|nr:MAG: hypothetical protein M1831_003130 [Alyxoria varia]